MSTYRCRLLRQWIAAILLMTGWLGPLSLPHSANDDPLCAPVDRLSGSSQVVLTSNVREHSPDHCIICHATRTMRSSLTAFGSSAMALDPGRDVVTLPDSPRGTYPYDRLPARAPPQV